MRKIRITAVLSLVAAALGAVIGFQFGGAQTAEVVAAAGFAMCWVGAAVGQLPERSRARRHYYRGLSAAGLVTGIVLVTAVSGHAARGIGALLIAQFACQAAASSWKRSGPYIRQSGLWILGDPNVKRPRKQLSPPSGTSPDRVT